MSSRTLRELWTIPQTTIFSDLVEVAIESHELPAEGASKIDDKGIFGRYRRSVNRRPKLTAILIRFFTPNSCRYNKKMPALEEKNTGANKVDWV